MNDRNAQNAWPYVLVAGAVLVMGLVGLYLLRDADFRSGPTAATVTEPAPAPASAPAAVTSRPVALPSEPAEQRPFRPLPSLAESDAEMVAELTELFGQSAVRQFLVPEHLIANIVVTIDNLPREKLAVEQRPIQPTPGQFAAAGPEGSRTIAPENYARYAPLVDILRRTDARGIVALYRGLKPLFQEAYAELGYPSASFDDRLIEVIDHLLATPVPKGEIALVQPSVHFRYADEELESRSAGQKLLIRMGPDNMVAIKTKLREIKEELR